MKHIKLFEDFDQDIYIEDAKYIIISHLGEIKDIPIDPKWNTKDLTLFYLEETPTDEQINRCEEHLKEEGFFLHINKKECIVGISDSIEEYCLNWLNTNFGNLKPVIKDGKTFYVDGDNKPFFYSHHGKSMYSYISYEKIWEFLSIYLGIGRKKDDITKRWLEFKYNLKKNWILPVEHIDSMFNNM